MSLPFLKHLNPVFVHSDEKGKLGREATKNTGETSLPISKRFKKCQDMSEDIGQTSLREIRQDTELSLKVFSGDPSIGLNVP